MQQPYITKNECLHRHVYHINSRNLRLGIYNEANGGFYGIRTKFGDKFIFCEYHWDNGPPYGTVKPLTLIPASLSKTVEVSENLPQVFCIHCQQPLKEEHDSVYKHEHLSGVPCAAGERVHGNHRMNSELYNFLTALEALFVGKTSENLHGYFKVRT